MAHCINQGRLWTPLPVRSCQRISGTSLKPGSRRQILFSIEAFTSQIHSKSSPHQEFFQVEEQRAGSQFNKGLCLNNSCLSGQFSFFLSCCSLAVSHSVCAHADIICKPSLLKIVALYSAATQSQEHTGSLHMQLPIQHREMLKLSLEPGSLDGLCVLA